MSQNGAPYPAKQCQSLLGYAEETHVRSKGKCQLCLRYGVLPLDFDLWRQLTVEHLIGESNGGYTSGIKLAVESCFKKRSDTEKDYLSEQIDKLNKVTACHFCNSMTSRFKNSEPDTMLKLLDQVKGCHKEEVLAHVHSRCKQILKDKQKNIAWKLLSIEEAFKAKVLPNFNKFENDLD